MALPGATLDDDQDACTATSTRSASAARSSASTACKPVIAGDTAGAAREVAEARRPDPGRASRRALAAEIYGLEILAEDVEDEDHNTTRFVVLSREPDEAPAGNGPGGHHASSSACATCRPRSTRRSAASPPTAST